VLTEAAIATDRFPDIRSSPEDVIDTIDGTPFWGVAKPEHF